jgi:nucleotide-binding universal stress UspA family protein
LSDQVLSDQNLTKVSLDNDETRLACIPAPVHLSQNHQVMKTILVPCDFSEPSVQAFRFAADIARLSRGEIHLLHAIELPALYNEAVVMSFEQAYLEDMKKNAEKNFNKLITRWAEGVKVKTHFKFGGLLKTVREMAMELKADLVVTGTHGASGLKEYTVGSNTEKIVRTLDIPVIAVKKAPKEVKTIVFPTRPDLDQEELTMKVKELQNFFKAKIHVLFVNTPALFKTDKEMNPALASFAKRFMLKDFTLNITNDIDEEQGIIHFAKEVKADLVAMRTHGRRGFAHFATGSIAEDVVNHIDCPIWTYKIK